MRVQKLEVCGVEVTLESLIGRYQRAGPGIGAAIAPAQAVGADAADDGAGDEEGWVEVCDSDGHAAECQRKPGGRR